MYFEFKYKNNTSHTESCDLCWLLYRPSSLTWHEAFEFQPIVYPSVEDHWYLLLLFFSLLTLLTSGDINLSHQRFLDHTLHHLALLLIQQVSIYI